MEIRYSSTTPNPYNKVGAKIEINYNVKQLTDVEIQELWDKFPHAEGEEINQEFIDMHQYCYNVVTIGNGRFNYSNIVESIIRDKYTSDQMEAITNNMTVIVSGFFEELINNGIIGATKYLITSINSENSKNFKAMQEWRYMAKATAKKLLKME